MLRLALRRAAAAASPLTNHARFYTTNTTNNNNNSVTSQMINYALTHARSLKSAESYAQADMILQQGLSNNNIDDDALATFMLAMSTLLYERGEVTDAVEKLQMVHQSARASPALKVAAWEAMVGMNLERCQDVTSSVLADNCIQLLSSNLDGGESSMEVVKSRAKAVKGLVHLVLGELKSAESFFDGCHCCNLEEGKDQLGNTALSYGEFLHASGNLSSAKDFYERILSVFEIKDTTDRSCLASANMVPEEVLLGATCALGQLLSHSGEFRDAEDLLTKALTKTEDHFGSTHPKVGIVLTCIAIMFKHKAKSEASSSILIQEGLYRKAIDLLKAPSLDTEAADMDVARRDIMALARGGYAEILCIQQNRRGEGERMKKWAEAAWGNRRLSLAQALEFADSSQAAIIDTRISRVV